MRNVTLLGLALLTAGCAVSKVDPLSVPLVYRPDTPSDQTLKSLSCPAVSKIEVVDKRSDPQLGVRYHESKPLKADVTAANDPAAWAQSGIQSFMLQNGVKLAGNGPRLVVDLNSLKTSENIWHRSGYEARVTLVARLQSPSGKTCWEESADNKAGNYGYSGSIENYQETVNSALDAATKHLIDSPLFSNALCHCSD
jgi:hypothetical protein